MNRSNLFWWSPLALVSLVLVSAACHAGGDPVTPMQTQSVKVNDVTPFEAYRGGILFQITSPIFIPPSGNWSFGEVTQHPKVSYVNFAPPNLDGIYFSKHLLDSAGQVQVTVAYTQSNDAGRYQMILGGVLRPPPGGHGKGSEPAWNAAETPDSVASNTFSAHAPEARATVLRTVGLAITAEATGSAAASYQTLKSGAVGVATSSSIASRSQASAAPSLPTGGSVQLISGWLTLEESLTVTAPSATSSATGDPVPYAVALSSSGR